MSKTIRGTYLKTGNQIQYFQALYILKLYVIFVAQPMYLFTINRAHHVTEKRIKRR